MSNDTVFYKIYLASRKSISRVVSRIVPPDEIEDIVQETYVRICQIENKDNIESPKSFMFKTAKNLALDYQKQASVRLVDGVDDMQDLELLLSDTSKDEMYQKTVSHGEFSNFCDAVRQLPIQCRKVFVLKKVYGYSQKEIAAQLSISESTVEKHISTGVKRCTIFMRNVQNISSNHASRAQSNVGASHE
jgi:RNA polymerase sigma factor (sigma-70 family)